MNDVLQLFFDPMIATLSLNGRHKSIIALVKGTFKGYLLKISSK
jgi:hypothetical protein